MKRLPQILGLALGSALAIAFIHGASERKRLIRQERFSVGAFELAPATVKIVVAADPGIPSVDHGVYDVTLTAEDGSTCAARDYPEGSTGRFVIFEAFMDLQHPTKVIRLGCHWKPKS